MRFSKPRDKCIHQEHVSAWLAGVFVLALAAQTASAVDFWVQDRTCCHDPTPCVGNGTDVNPFCGIQEAIEAGLPNSITTPIKVWVKPGVYSAPFDNVKFYSRGVQLKSTAGHSNPDGTPRTKINAWVAINPDDEAPEARLDGFWITAPNGRGVDAYARSGATVKVLNNKITGNSGPGIIAGGSGSLTISRNLIVDNNGATATGILVGGGSPQIIGNMIEGNIVTDDEFGGGITVRYGTPSLPTTPVIAYTSILNNRSTFGGGGIRITDWFGKLDESAVTLIHNCVIAGNKATESSGGGLYLYQADGAIKIVNTVFRANEAKYKGGGAQLGTIGFFAESEGEIVCLDPCDPPTITTKVKMQNCLFTCNKAHEGGGLYVPSNTQATLANCTIANNETWATGAAEPPQQNGGGIVSAAACTIVQNSVVWNNKNDQYGVGPHIVKRDCGRVQLSYSLLNDGCEGVLNLYDGGWPTDECSATSVYDSDPLFACAPTGGACVCGETTDWRPVRPSPAIDSGENALVLQDFADLNNNSITSEYTPLDLELKGRFIDDPATSGYSVDIGPYEFSGVRVLADTVPKSRFMSVVIPADGTGVASRLFVRLQSLQHPVPANLPQYPPPDFSACEGDLRYVLLRDEPCPMTGGTYECGTLVSTPPDPIDWGDVLNGQPLHVTGSEVVPSSEYLVWAQLPVGGAGSAPLLVKTTRWGDIVEPFQNELELYPSQPDVLDIPKVVDGILGSFPGPRPRLQGGVIDLVQPEPNVLDISRIVDAVKSAAYPFVDPVCQPE